MYDINETYRGYTHYTHNNVVDYALIINIKCVLLYIMIFYELLYVYIKRKFKTHIFFSFSSLCVSLNCFKF